MSGFVSFTPIALLSEGSTLLFYNNGYFLLHIPVLTRGK